MSNENIPEKINPYRLAEAGASLQGTLRIQDMQRLRTSLADDDGKVFVKIQFGVDEQGIRFLSWHLETELKLQCQRCMEPFVYGIIGDFMSAVVNSEEEAQKLPEAYEPVQVDEDGMITILDMVEDELIIGLPIVPRHEQKDCKVELPRFVVGSDKESEGESNNPFKVIEILRAKNRNKE